MEGIMEKNERMSPRQVIISGLALFAIFFGAGNLIIPPLMGSRAGQGWLEAFAGFTLSDTVLVVLGVLAMTKNDGDILKFTRKISPLFGKLLGLIIVLCIGPLMAMPRTAATTFEMGVLPFAPNFSPVLFSVIFFAVVWLFTINRSKVIDIVGGYLTPVLIVILAIIIGSGLIAPLSPPTAHPSGQLAAGVIEGYNTMDCIGAILMSGMIFNNFKAHGVSSRKALAKYTILSGLIAGIGLCLVYGGLTYLGMMSGGFAHGDMTRIEILNAIVRHLLGAWGNVALSAAITFACLTTAAGLVSLSGSYFSEMSKGRFNYKLMVTVVCIVSGAIAIIGVDDIMKFSVPVLLVIYPLVISLIVLNLIDRDNLDTYVYRTTLLFTAAISVVDCLKTLGFKELSIVRLFDRLPLASLGFSWLPIAAVGFVIGLLLSRTVGKRSAA